MIHIPRWTSQKRNTYYSEIPMKLPDVTYFWVHLTLFFDQMFSAIKRCDCCANNTISIWNWIANRWIIKVSLCNAIIFLTQSIQVLSGLTDRNYRIALWSVYIFCVRVEHMIARKWQADVTKWTSRSSTVLKVA